MKRARAISFFWMGVSLAWVSVMLVESRPASFQAVHAFGDSLTAATGGPYFQGRWCNGPVWPDQLAVKWGLSSSTRNNHAQGLATSQAVLNQARALTAVELENALCVCFAGTVDFGSAFRPNPSATSWDPLTRQVLVNSSNIVMTLAAKGARSIAVLNQPDLMRFPEFSNFSTKDRSFYRQSMQRFNDDLAAALTHINAAQPDLRLVVVDLFALFDVVLDQSDVYGLTEVNVSAIHDPKLLNKAYDGPGRNYAFWDASSVTSRMQSLIADSIDAAWYGTALALAKSEAGWVLSAQRLLVGKNYSVQSSTNARDWTPLHLEQALYFATDLVIPATDEPPARFFRIHYD